MIYMTAVQAQACQTCLPRETIEHLQNNGLPEQTVFRGFHCVFDLSLVPIGDGDYFAVGRLENEPYLLALQRNTGHFGFIATDPTEETWQFVNSSVAQFVECCQIADALWNDGGEHFAPSEMRGKSLETKVNQIDPNALIDAPWGLFVYELKEEIVG